MNDLFLRRKPCKMLVILKDAKGPTHISELAKESGATYVHITKLVHRLEAAGIVSIEKSGKKRNVKLTERGLKIATLTSELMAQLSEKPKTQPAPQAAQQ